MAGFETVVRPAVFPSIRPAPARSLPPKGDPSKGFCVIKGSSGKTVDLPSSWSASTSKSRATETERRVDEVRVYQVEDDGTVNKKNFVDVDVANRIKTKEAGATAAQQAADAALNYAQRQLDYEIKQYNFMRQVEKDNIEILNRDVIKKNPDAPK
jgi:hypothetical protein